MSTVKETVFPDHDESSDDSPGLRGSHVRQQKRSVWKILGIVSLVLALVVVGGTVAVGLWVRQSIQTIDRNIERFPAPDASIPESERPAVVAPKAKNVLMLGSDSRISGGDPSQWVYGAQRTDAIMILHLPADRSGATVLSIPRDSWVTIPGRKGKAKINAAFSYGGPTLMVRTVEKLTGVRIDHTVIVDFEGFVDITDRVGGVDITVAGEGTRHLNGAEALAYVRTRKTLPNGDFDRVKRQQNWIRTIMAEVLTRDMATSPKRLMDTLTVLSRNVSTDESLSIGEMRELAWSMRSVRSADVTFMTVPVAGTGRSPDGKQSIVELDPEADAPLFEALRTDRVAQYLAEYQPAVLGRAVN